MTVELRVIRSDASIDARRGLQRRVERIFPAIVAPIVEPLETVVANSIEVIGRGEWGALFAHELDDWHYLRALECAELAGCEPIYFAIRSRGRLVAAAPAFVGRRALAEPWRTRERTQWWHAPARALVLGSPFAAACPIGLAPRATAAERRLLVDRLLRAARAEAARRGLHGLVVSGGDAEPGDDGRRAGSLLFARTKETATARISLPRWSFADYLSCFDDELRHQLLRVCEQSARYDRHWRVDFDRDLEPMLALGRDTGLDEIGETFFKSLLGSSVVSAECLLVRSTDGSLAGFSIVLHDVRALREKLTVVSRREDGALLRGVIWLETLRFCLERGIGTYESASELALSAARPHELVQRSCWIAARDAAVAITP